MLVYFLLAFSLLGTCLSSAPPPKKLYGQACTASEDCVQGQGLSCENQVCKCDPSGATVYSLSKNRCVGAAGRECLRTNNETFCVTNSKCHDYGYMHLCTCRDGYYQSKDGNCYNFAKYHEKCIEEDFSCGDTVSNSIVCTDSVCECVLGQENQSYDSVVQKCTSFVNKPCIPNYYKPCPINSYCGEFNEQIGGASFMAGHACLCSPGYVNTKSGQCLARFGTSCGTNNPCAELLGCLNGVCQCRNPLNEVFNEQTQQCAILVGSICKIGDVQKCVNNAECVPEKNSTKHGTCQCATGFSSTPTGGCLLDINQPCGYSDQLCNYHNSLVCMNEGGGSRCDCLDSSLSYSKVSKSCVSLANVGFCGTISLLNENREITVLCESNAICSKWSGVGHSSNARRICKASSSAKH